jgi:putative Mn2+ efflux pump MntP
VTETPSKQRNFAPVFFVLAVLTIGLGITQAIKLHTWIAPVADFVIAAVMIAMGLRLLKPDQPAKTPRPLRAPRPPR